VRISARSERDLAAEALADTAEAAVTAALGRFVWSRGSTSWAAAVGEALAARGWTLATSERGTAGALVGLLRGLAAVRVAEVHNDPGDAAVADAAGADAVRSEAERVRVASGADVGFAIHAIPREADTRVLISIASPEGTVTEERLAFQRGSQGADRAAIAGTAVLLESLRGPATG
jgi:hypothetical protein